MAGFRGGSSSSYLSDDPLVNTEFYGISKPEYIVPADAMPTPYYESNNSDDNNINDGNNERSLDYLKDYNNAVDANNQFGPGGMMQQNIDNPVANPTDFYGNPEKKEINSPSPMNMIPGYGLNQTVPTSGYGTPGTYSANTGNRFDSNSRGINPITGQYEDEYGTKGAFLNNLSFYDNDKAEQGNLRDMEYAAARSELADLKSGKTDIMGNPTQTGLSTEAEKKVQESLNTTNNINTTTASVPYIDDTAVPAVAPNYAVPAPQQSYSNDDGQDSSGNHNNTGGGGSSDYGSMFSAGGEVAPNLMMRDPLEGLI